MSQNRKNPYGHAYPPHFISKVVQDTEMFFGRREELAQLQDHARKSKSVAVVGMRRIGKSSLLFQFAYQIRKRSDSLVIVYLDLHDARLHTVSGLLTATLTGLDARLNGKYRLGEVTKIETFINAVEQMHEDGFCPVLCLDEMEELMAHECFDHDFFETWYQLGHEGKLLFITASRAPLADLIKPSGEVSPFCNLFTQLNLAGLDRNDAHVLLTQPFRRARQRQVLPPRYIHHAIELAGGHPYYLQIAGSLLWEHGPMDPPLWREKFITVARKPLYQLWTELSADEKIVARQLAGVETTLADGWVDVQKHLLELGVAERNDRGRVNLFTPLLVEWIKSGELTEVEADGSVGDLSKPSEELQDAERTVLLTYTVMGLLSASALAWLVMQFVSGDPIYLLITFVTGFLFTLIGVNKITNGQYLEWLNRLLKRSSSL